MFNSNDESHEGGNAAAQRFDIQPQAVRREIFLDIEDTVVTPVINGWHNFEVINLEKIRDVIASFEPHAVNIFSFAIWDQHQLKLFNAHCRPHLERLLGVTFNLVLTVDDDIIPTCCNQMGIVSLVDFSEMSAFWSKQGAFRLCMRHHAINHRRHNPNLSLHVLLLDDVVYNERMEWPDLKTTVEQRNIDQI